ncbi:MAG: hypothetical protein ACTHM7_14220 [Ginsengibacter sp.]
MMQACNYYQTKDQTISYHDLLETAFNPDTPDAYADYLQDVLKKARATAMEIGWAMEGLSFVLNPVTGKITLLG